MLTTYKVLRRNDTTRNFFLALRVAILINAALSVSLNEAACIATKHTSNTINATLNGSIVHSVNRLSANSTRPLRAHNRFAARQCNTRTSRRVYKVIRITPRGVSRQDTTLGVLAQVAQSDGREVIQPDEIGDRVPRLANTVIVNRFNDELYRLRSSGLNAVPNVTDSIDGRLEPALNLVKATPNSVENVFLDPHPHVVEVVLKAAPQAGNALYDDLEEPA